MLPKTVHMLRALRERARNFSSRLVKALRIVGTGFGPVAFVAFDLRLGHEAGGLRPPLASPAPTSLACPHLPRLPPC